MPQINVNSTNINTFGFTANIDIYNKRIVFDISTLSDFVNPLNIIGVCFKVEDVDGVIIHDIDFNNPDIPPGGTTYTLDLSSYGLPFIVGNTFKITGEIKDQDGQVYSTDPAIKTVCKPPKITESGYVPGVFQVTPNCTTNVLNVKDLTLFTYDNKKPSTKTVAGTLNYPTGTIDPVTFTGTPFSNTVVYSGQYSLHANVVAKYDMGDDIYVSVTYITRQSFPIVCSNFLGDIACCLTKLQKTYSENCDNAVGLKAKQQTFDILLPLTTGLVKQSTGQDASYEVAFIKKQLGCDCGSSSLGQNEVDPVNLAQTSIVITGDGGTTVPAATMNGNTKNYVISSNVYQVVKGNTGDLAWSIATDTATPNTVKYKLTFNYTVMAGYILDAITNSPSLKTQLNNLVNATGASIAGLDGGCVIDLTTKDYVLSQNGLTGSTLLVNVVINSTTYSAPSNLFATDNTGIQNWLNSLSLGTFAANYNSGVLTITSNGNENILSTLTVSAPGLTIPFQSTSAQLVEVLQAMIDYMCALTASQVKLAGNLSLSYFDYNGVLQVNNYTTNDSQQVFNAGIATSINNLANKINALTSVNCAMIKALFPDNPIAMFGATSRVYGYDQDGNCVAFTPQQIALSVFQAANAYSNVKAAFCAISCTDPASCPEIDTLNIGFVGTDIAFYGVTWTTPPTATQQVTLRYKLQSASTYLTVSSVININPTGNIVGSSPILITGLTPGSAYNVWVSNNCGGSGQIVLRTVPTSGLFTADYLLASLIYDVCGATPVTLYSSSSFGPGVAMFTDAGLTTPVTGSSYIAPVTTGQLFTIDSGTGVVGSDTGYNCGNGLAGSYILGNDSGTICGDTPVTLYTNGAFAPGSTLYLDAAMTIVVTGYDFVVNTSDSIIYNLDNGTGLVGASTGSSCTSTPTAVKLDTTTNTICANTPVNIYTSAPFNTGVTLFNDAGLSSPVTGYNYVSNAGSIYALNPSTGVVGILLANNCGDLIILNGTSWATVTAIGSLSGFALSGTIAPGGSQPGTHGAFSANIQVTITGSGSGSIRIFKNSIQVGCINVSSAGTYTFGSLSFIVGDAINIALSNSAC